MAVAQHGAHLQRVRRSVLPCEDEWMLGSGDHAASPAVGAIDTMNPEDGSAVPLTSWS